MTAPLLFDQGSMRRALDALDHVMVERGLVPSADWIFLMKLNAGRFVDRADMVRLWPLTNFASPQAAVDRCWDAYPGAADDKFLVNYVSEIANEAG